MSSKYNLWVKKDKRKLFSDLRERKEVFLELCPALDNRKAIQRLIVRSKLYDKNL
jgi:hypothetical protein